MTPALDGEPEQPAREQRGEQTQPVAAGQRRHLERDVGADHRHGALREVDDARRPPDEHERQREQREDGTAREAGAQEEDRVGPSEPQVGVAEARRRRRARAAGPDATTSPSAEHDAVVGDGQRADDVLLGQQHGQPGASARLRSTPMIWATTRGASPSDGSSSSSTSGRATSARPSASICRSPPESWWPGVVAAPGQRLEQLVRPRRRPRARSRSAPQPAEPQVLVDGQLGDDAAALGDVGDPAPDPVLDADARRGPARRAGCCPPVTGTRPDRVRSSVVLPAPLAPTSGDDAAGRHVEVDVVQHRGAAVADGQAAEPPGARSRGSSPRCPRGRPRRPPGRRATSSGVPAAITRPKSSTTTRSAHAP